MMAASRAAALAVLALAVAMMLAVGALADRALLGSTIVKTKAYKKCAKAFPGCVACSGEGDAYTCDACIANADFDADAGKCVCDEADGYGTITKRQLKAYKRANKNKQLSVLVGVVIVPFFCTWETMGVLLGSTFLPLTHALDAPPSPTEKKKNSYGKFAVCVLCADFDLAAFEGRCVTPVVG
jgi:hypothetical protein